MLLQSRAPTITAHASVSRSSQPSSGSASKMAKSTSALTKNAPRAAGSVKASSIRPAQATTTPETTKTPASFRQGCTRFFDIAALDLDDQEALDQPAPSEGQSPIDSELLKLLGAAFKASKRDSDGYAPLAELGQRAKAVSSFAVRNYGYTRLSDLIRAVPNFDVKTGADGRLLVKRLR